MSETLETASPETMEQDLDGSADLKAVLSDLDGADPDAMTIPDKPDDDFASDPESDAPARDEKGRFAPKGDAQAELTTPATDRVAAPAPVAAEGQSAEAAPSREAIPFQYRATGQTHAWEGVTLDATGNALIPAEQVPVLRQKLAAAAQFEADTYPRVQRLEAENRQLREQTSAKEAQATALFDRLMSFVNDPNEEQALTNFLNFRQQAPLVAQKAEVEYYKSLAQKGQTAQPASQQSSPSAPPREVAEQHAVDTFEGLKLDLAASPEYRGLVSDADWKQIGDAVTRLAPAFVRPVTAEEAKQYGMQPGDYALDTDALAADVKDRLGVIVARAKATQTAKAAAEAAKFNKGATPGKTAAPQRQPARAEAPMAAAPKDARDAARERAQLARKFKKEFLSGASLDDDED